MANDKMTKTEGKRVLIVGGGFGGVVAALTLARKRLPNVKIVLVSEKPHFEYHAALYRVVTGRSPFEVCVPLADIFEGYEVEVVEDKIDNVELEKKQCWGVSGSRYQYDHLVLGLGSETVYYDTPGLLELAFGFKDINEALKLKRHLHEMMQSCSLRDNKGENVCQAHVVVVGGGASGTELSAELVVYMEELSKKHRVDPSLVTVDLIQSPSRLLPDLPERLAERVEKRIRSLGVNVYVNRRLVREEVEKVFMKDMEMRAKTVVWTAGVAAHHLYGQIKGLEVNDKGKVVVDKYLWARGQEDVYVVGDGAATEFSGMAQTAMKEGKLAAENIGRSVVGEEKKAYVPVRPAYSIPVGPGWAATLWHGLEFYGRMGWVLRRLADLRFFLTILPMTKALAAFADGARLSESCPVCTKMITEEVLAKH